MKLEVGQGSVNKEAGASDLNSFKKEEADRKEKGGRMRRESWIEEGMRLLFVSEDATGQGSWEDHASHC